MYAHLAVQTEVKYLKITMYLMNEAIEQGHSVITMSQNVYTHAHSLHTGNIHHHLTTQRTKHTLCKEEHN